MYTYNYAPLIPEGFHECGPAAMARYRMLAGWIDTDNKVWAEPSHEYTAPCAQPEEPR